MNRENAARASKSLIVATKVDSSDAELPKSRSAHYTRFYCDVEVCLFENAWWMILQNFGDCNEFCVTSALEIHQFEEDNTWFIWNKKMRECFPDHQI